jgi:glycosyltransferase involved in cell wall biosynthesis
VRIALAHPYSWPEVRRGGERLLHDLAWTLARAGHDVRIVTSATHRSRVDVLDGIKVHRRGHHWGLDRFGLTRGETFGFEAWAWLLRYRHDLVIGLTPSAAIGAKASGQRTVHACLGWPTAQFWWARPRERRLFRLADRLTAATTVLSDAVADSVHQLTSRRPTVLAPGIRLDAFPLQIGPRTGRPTVLFASWAEERGKGLDLLCAAFAQVLDVVPEARLWLAGGGDPSWALASLHAEDRHRVGAAIDVVCEPGQPITPQIYGQAHVTALPSVVDAFGLVLLESLACGTPAVGSAAGGIVDILTGTPVGRLVPHGHVPALAAALLDAIELAAKPDTAEAARAHAAGYDWAGLTGARHVQFYEHLASHG